ncbi:hypothetical protein BH11MYX4_BH11MYX4_62600 [soil metagenome]
MPLERLRKYRSPLIKVAMDFCAAGSFLMKPPAWSREVV